MITVLKIEVGEPPEIKEIPNELSSLQHEVGGLIECVYLDDGSTPISQLPRNQNTPKEHSKMP